MSSPEQPSHFSQAAGLCCSQRLAPGAVFEEASCAPPGSGYSPQLSSELPVEAASFVAVQSDGLVHVGSPSWVLCWHSRLQLPASRLAELFSLQEKSRAQHVSIKRGVTAEQQSVACFRTGCPALWQQPTHRRTKKKTSPFLGNTLIGVCNHNQNKSRHLHCVAGREHTHGSCIRIRVTLA